MCIKIEDITDRIFEKVDKTKRAYGMNSCKDVYLALGCNEFDELVEAANLYILDSEGCRISSLKTFYDLEIILMKDYYSYFELLRKL